VNSENEAEAAGRGKLTSAPPARQSIIDDKFRALQLRLQRDSVVCARHVASEILQSLRLPSDSLILNQNRSLLIKYQLLQALPSDKFGHRTAQDSLCASDVSDCPGTFDGLHL
jgi:hypothetical protein